MRDFSISVHFARAVLRHAVQQGLDPVALLRRNRISPRLLLEENARISIERFADLQVGTMVAMVDSGEEGIWLRSTCELTGSYASYDDVLDTSVIYPQLNDTLYYQFLDCLSALEEIMWEL